MIQHEKYIPQPLQCNHCLTQAPAALIQEMLLRSRIVNTMKLLGIAAKLRESRWVTYSRAYDVMGKGRGSGNSGLRVVGLLEEDKVVINARQGGMQKRNKLQEIMWMNETTD